MDFTQGAETRPCIVIAIDFGSTFTAVAFAHTSEVCHQQYSLSLSCSTDLALAQYHSH